MKCEELCEFMETLTRGEGRSRKGRSPCINIAFYLHRCGALPVSTPVALSGSADTHTCVHRIHLPFTQKPILQREDGELLL